jgi:hypothetical protein
MPWLVLGIGEIIFMQDFSPYHYTFSTHCDQLPKLTHHALRMKVSKPSGNVRHMQTLTRCWSFSQHLPNYTIFNALKEIIAIHPISRNHAPNPCPKLPKHDPGSERHKDHISHSLTSSSCKHTPGLSCHILGAI